MKEKDFSLEKIPPQNLEAEQAVLGAMLLDNSAIESARRLLPANYFYAEAHRKTFLATLEVYEAQKKVDLVMLVDALRQKGQLEQVGGTAYLSRLLDDVVSSLLLPHHAGIMKRKAILRQLISGSGELMFEAYADSLPLEDILGRAQEMVAGLLKQSAAEEASQKLGMPLEQMSLYFASCREMPFESLNRALGGLFGGELIFVGARPGMGKSALVHTFLRHTAIQEGRPVIYFAAEMSREVIYARQLAAMCRLPYNDLKRGRINQEQAGALVAAHQKIDTAPIYEYVINNKISAVALMAQVRKLADQTKKEIGLVIAENLQQIIRPGKNFKTRKEEADVILESLRSFGLEMKIPLVISSQINREPEDREDKRPRLADLKDTGQIEEIADKIILPFRPNYYDKKQFDGPEPGELIIAKGGPPISLPFKFFGPCLDWEEAWE